MVLLVPSAAQCFSVAGPVVAVGGLVWFCRHSDEIMARLFPALGWERDLGWLNLVAQRRADRILRVLTHLLHLALLFALVGILAFSWLLGQPHDFDSYTGAFSMPFEFIHLALCLGVWIYYLAAILGPRVRDEFEKEELARFRAENPDVEEEMPRPGRFNVTVWGAPDQPPRF